MEERGGGEREDITILIVIELGRMGSSLSYSPRWALARFTVYSLSECHLLRWQ